MRTENYKDLIEQYVVGTISDGDKTMLESKLASDASVRAEMKAQSEVIEGLKQFRKTQLKTRLNNVPVETGVFETVGQSTFVKVAASVGAAVVLVGGLYYFSDNSTEEVAVFEALSPITSVEEPIGRNEITIKELPAVATPKKPGDRAIVVNEAAKTPVIAKVEETQPDFNTPAVVEFESEQDFEAEKIDGDSRTTVATPVDAAKPIDVEISPSSGKENRLQYQFYEEKLHLYGDFKNVPYEILEINNKDGKKTYLYHEGIFYQLSYPSKDIKDLLKITNEELLKELTIFRENKALD